jgi:hypothetical protein
MTARELEGHLANLPEHIKDLEFVVVNSPGHDKFERIIPIFGEILVLPNSGPLGEKKSHGRLVAFEI